MNTARAIVQCLIIAAITFSCDNKNQISRFTGTLIYSQDLTVSGAMAAMGATRETLLENLLTQGDWGDTIRITYNTRGDYRISVQNPKHSYKIYLADSNKIYSFLDGDNSKSCIVQEAIDMDIVGNPNVPNKVPFDTTVVISGVTCKAVRFRWKMGRVDYFYDSTKLKIDPALFARHTTEGLADYLATTKSLPFRITRDIAGMRVQQTLIGSREEAVNQDLFNLPRLDRDEELNPMKLPGIEVKRVVGER
jgi:hypothetical protein